VKTLGFVLLRFLGVNMEVSGEYERKAKALHRAVFGIIKCSLSPKSREEKALCDIKSRKVYDAMLCAVNSMAMCKEYELAGDDVNYRIEIDVKHEGINWRVAKNGGPSAFFKKVLSNLHFFIFIEIIEFLQNNLFKYFIKYNNN
jgi:hypothetical protein